MPHSVDINALVIKRPPVTLHGRWLVTARLGVLIFAVVRACSAGVSLPQSWNPSVDLQDILGGSPSAARIAAANQALHNLDLSPRSLAIITMTTGFAQLISFYAAGIYLVRQKSNELMAMIVAVFLFATASGQFPPDLITMQATHPIEATIGLSIDLVFVLGFFNLFFLFPDGRFTPRWTIAVSVVLLVGPCASGRPTP